jgi:hypothetical protein
MPRRTRANAGKQETPPPGLVTVRRVSRNTEWTEPQARDLLRQGYTAAQVAKKTGYPLAWVEAQPIPRKSLLDQALGRGGPE